MVIIVSFSINKANVMENILTFLRKGPFLRYYVLYAHSISPYVNCVGIICIICGGDMLHPYFLRLWFRYIVRKRYETSVSAWWCKIIDARLLYYASISFDQWFVSVVQDLLSFVIIIQGMRISLSCTGSFAVHNIIWYSC